MTDKVSGSGAASQTSSRTDSDDDGDVSAFKTAYGKSDKVDAGPKGPLLLGVNHGVDKGPEGQGPGADGKGKDVEPEGKAKGHDKASGDDGPKAKGKDKDDDDKEIDGDDSKDVDAKPLDDDGKPGKKDKARGKGSQKSEDDDGKADDDDGVKTKKGDKADEADDDEDDDDDKADEDSGPRGRGKGHCPHHHHDGTDKTAERPAEPKDAKSTDTAQDAGSKLTGGSEPTAASNPIAEIFGGSTEKSEKGGKGDIKIELSITVYIQQFSTILWMQHTASMVGKIDGAPGDQGLTSIGPVGFANTGFEGSDSPFDTLVRDIGGMIHTALGISVPTKPADVGEGGPSYKAGSGCPYMGAGGNSAGNAEGEPLRRLFEPAYGDGQGELAGADRPNPRDISNAVAQADAPKDNAQGASDLFWAYGQFLDHDLSLTEGGDEAANIDVPQGDPRFDPNGTGTQQLRFNRSHAEMDAEGTRQQINDITPLLDGSNVYGSTEEQSDSLRSFDGGKLRMNEVDNLPEDDKGFYQAGDVRVNENPVLTSLHTVFAREHNRIADAIAEANPSWSDQQIFEAAQDQNVAQMQAITKNEFLPMLLGTNALPAYDGYKDVDPQISNAFSTAAFRFGHSLVSDNLLMVDEAGNRREVPLAQAFFNPEMLDNGGLEAAIRGAAEQRAQAMDPEIVDGLRDFVMPGPSAMPLDLASLNIQRGRDHGLPTLNEAREQLGLDKLTGFDDPRLREGVGEKLSQVYDSIDDVDLWIGMMSEAPVGGGMVGETQGLVLADQFTRMRDGDPDWYEGRLPPAMVTQINDTSLADIIERNTKGVDIQDQAMRTPDAQLPTYYNGLPYDLMGDLKAYW